MTYHLYSPGTNVGVRIHDGEIHCSVPSVREGEILHGDPGEDRDRLHGGLFRQSRPGTDLHLEL